MPRSRSRKKYKRIKKRFSGEKETDNDTCDLDTCKGSENVIISHSGLKSRYKRKYRSRSRKQKR